MLSSRFTSLLVGVAGLAAAAHAQPPQSNSAGDAPLVRESEPAPSATTSALAPRLQAGQSNSTGGTGGVPIVRKSPPVLETGGCINGFVGDTTIAGGWIAFEAASGKTMEVLVSGVADFTPVASIPSSLGNVGLAPNHEKRTVGASWGTWSHGYLGEIFWTVGATATTLTMPPGTTAFDFYIEPNPFAVHTFTVTGNCTGGGSVQILVSADGSAGASHGGFWTEAGETISTITISGPVDWAIGELRISDDAPSCINGFVGDTTIAGGWTAFEAASGKTMEVLVSGVADFTPVASIPSSFGSVGLAPSHEKRTVGASWGTWSHGYLGEVFWTVGATATTLTMPAGTTAFDFYIEPNPFAVHTFSVTGNCTGGGSVNIQVSADGSAGASHGGFWTADGSTISTVTFTGPVDWAIGELRVSNEGPPGSNYCRATVNSTGFAAAISATGSASIADNDLTLFAGPVPNQMFIFFYGPNQIDVPFGNGRLCVGGGLTRLLPPTAAVGNQASRVVDLAFQGITPGALRFQCWFRDPAAGGAAFNTSDGYSITFVP